MRQFGFRQGIPRPCDNDSTLHKYDLRGGHNVDWTDRHGQYIRQWAFGCDHIVMDHMEFGPLGYHDLYMVWYRSITVQFLTCSGSFHELLVIFISYVFNKLYFILFFLTYELIFYLVWRLVAYIKYMILHRQRKCVFVDYVPMYWRLYMRWIG